VLHHPAADVSDRRYDVVIVGAGIAGAILAKELGQAGRRVLILEAGTGQALDFDGYRGNLETYYKAVAKATNAPYPANANAPQPDVLDIISTDPVADSRGYLVQQGPLPYKSDYPRTAGGTTLHWLGTCLRMLPEDFRLHSLYGVGLDWPIGYPELKPYYARAEREIGVSAEAEDQRELQALLGIQDWFDPDYVYPMHRIPQSYSDRLFADGLAGMSIDYDGRPYPVRVTSTPQGRNGMPNARYPGGFTPVGAVGNPEIGQRCQGNSSCVPICPVQAKYNAVKTLDAAVATGNVDIVTQAVASELKMDGAGRITGIVYKTYRDAGSPAYDVHSAHGTIFALGAHVAENVKLLLASGIGGDAAGRYLMDHPVLLTWGLADRPLGTFRGPGSSSGIESLRGGAFRERRAAFRVEIDNWGWNWAAGAPASTVEDMVFQKDALFGTRLRRSLFDHVQRQVRFGFLMEVPAEAGNRITIAPAYKDRLDNFRPIVSFDLPDYTRAGIAEARRTSKRLFEALNIVDHTLYSATDPGHFTYGDEGYTWQGAGHYIGGHVMGSRREESVVDADQRVWGHDNLWLVGCGNMPSEGTSNPTLTMAALTFMAAGKIARALQAGPR
jgi:choline dehydrogenase-like flavoprotein